MYYFKSADLLPSLVFHIIRDHGKSFCNHKYIISYHQCYRTAILFQVNWILNHFSILQNTALLLFSSSSSTSRQESSVSTVICWVTNTWFFTLTMEQFHILWLFKVSYNLTQHYTPNSQNITTTHALSSKKQLCNWGKNSAWKVW